MFLLDLRQAFRQLVHAPAFSALIVLTLGVGIGANALVYSILQSTVLQPLGSIDAERLVYLWRAHESNQMRTSIGLEQLETWQESVETLEEIHALAMQTRHVSGPIDATRMQIGSTSPGFFSFLGVQPMLGRAFAADEATAGRDQVVLLGYGIWQSVFGGDEGVLGESLLIDDRPHTIIGVLPRDFGLQAPHNLVRAWVPMVPETAPRGVIAMGRIAPGHTVEQVDEELAAMPSGEGAMAEWHGDAETPEQSVGNSFKTVVWSFQGAVLLVLLIAGANTANLLLARGSQRGREMSVRAAIGAGRGRLVRQLLVEALLLSLAGGALGLGIAVGGLRIVEALRPGDLRYFETLRLDPSVVAVTAALAIGCGVLFGLVPALQTSNDRLLAGLSEGGRGGSDGPRGSRLRSALVVAEVALSTLLLIGAGLLVASFLSLVGTDAGFEVDDVLVARVALPSAYEEDAPARARFWHELRREIAVAVGPDADAVGIASGVAPQVGVSFGEPTLADIEPAEPEALEELNAYTRMTPEVFEALRMRFLSGAPALSGEELTVVISETLARRLWGRVDVVGREFLNYDEPLRVAGVVPDVKAFGLRSQRGNQQIYEILGPDGDWFHTNSVVIRAEDPLSLVPAVRRAVAALEPDAVVEEASTARERFGETIALERFNAQLMVAFAAVALALSLVGIYGVLSYSVARRVPELGVRMALGATAGSVLRLVGRQGAALLGTGLVIGLVAAIFSSRLLASQLHGVEGFDPLTYGLASLLLAGVGLAACALPAWRATRVDPLVALKAD